MLSRWKGMETCCGVGKRSLPGIGALDMLSRLKGMETYDLKKRQKASWAWETLDMLSRLKGMET